MGYKSMAYLPYKLNERFIVHGFVSGIMDRFFA